jgi:hypothetical protein
MPATYIGSTQATIATIEEVKSACIELYDSSAMQHLSPYCQNLITY